MYFEYRSYKCKKRYRFKGDARKMMTVKSHASGVSLRCYYCDFCDGYHLTSH